MLPYIVFLSVLPFALAQSEDSPSPVVSASTAIPSSTAPPTAVIEEQRVPAPQSWCADPIYCAGDILQTVALSSIFPDSKTFVDKPTLGSINDTLSAFERYQSSGGNLTYQELEEFVSDYFKGEGLELQPVSIRSDFNPAETSFLSNVTDPVLSGWMEQVIGYWGDLIRETDPSALANSTSDSSLIPLQYPVVVPGGRYREVYYWDSFWILEGLLNSGLPDYARNLLENFLDQIEQLGFVPNGGRTYYLNRSQPPVLAQMLALYVNFTQDTSILERALPLVDLEQQFWQNNRSITVTSPYTNASHSVARYDVFLNTAPRPEGYVEDYETVNLSNPSLNETEAEELYKELASGAESGWDYSSRWMKDPLANTSDPLQSLRSLDIRSLAPVDLNAILTSNHYVIADLYELVASNSSSSASNYTSRAALHREQGDTMKEALFDLFWDENKLAFYDFNSTSSERSDFFSLATYYPFWLNLFPDEILTSEESARGAFAGLHAVLDRYPGAVPCTLQDPAVSLNWDFPNAWPPHQYIIAKALDNLPANVSSSSYSTAFPPNGSAFSLVPNNQFGVGEETLPATNESYIAESVKGLTDGSWRDALLSVVVNRYITSSFCSWYSTGGEIEGVLDQLPADQLNITHTSTIATGQMFEKFDATAVDAAGGGGEYEVVTGFGWTNGVVIWMGARHADLLKSPACPAISVQKTPGSANTTSLAKFHGFRVKTEGK